MPDRLLNKLLLTPAAAAPAHSSRPSPAARASKDAFSDSFSNALDQRISGAGREPGRSRPVATIRSPERPDAPPARERPRELRRAEDSAAAARPPEVAHGDDRETSAEERASVADVPQPASSLTPATESLTAGENAALPADAALAASIAGLVPAPAAVTAEVAAAASDEAVLAPVLSDGTGGAAATPLLEKLIAEVTAAAGEAPSGVGERLIVAGRSAPGEATPGVAGVLPARVDVQLPDAAGTIPGPPADAPATGVPAVGFSAAVRSEPVAQLPVHTPASQPRAWAEDVGNRVVWLVGRNESKAELVLTPPQLGKLEVSIHVSGDQTIAHFVAATSAARDALEQAMPRLREMMQQAGISLGETSVGTSGGQQAGHEESPSGRGARGAAYGTASGDAETHAATPIAVDWSRGGTGRVDTFA